MGRHKNLLKSQNMKRANQLMERHLLKEAPGMPLWRVCGPDTQGGFSAGAMGGMPTGLVVSFFVSASTSWYSTAPLTPAGTINTAPFSPTTSLVNSDGINHQTAADVMSGLADVEAGGCTGININSPAVSDPDWMGAPGGNSQNFCAEYLGYGDMQSSGAWPVVYPPGTIIGNSWIAPQPASSVGNPASCACCDYEPNTGGGDDDQEEWIDMEYDKTKTKKPTKPTDVIDDRDKRSLNEQWLNQEIKRYKRLF